MAAMMDMPKFFQRLKVRMRGMRANTLKPISPALVVKMEVTKRAEMAEVEERERKFFILLEVLNLNFKGRNLERYVPMATATIATTFSFILPPRK
nr:hypothetical protein [Archaeoglobus sp.]